MVLILRKNNRNPLSEVILTNSIPEAKHAAGTTPVIAKSDPPKNLLIAIETKYLTCKEWCSQ